MPALSGPGDTVLHQSQEAQVLCINGRLRSHVLLRLGYVSYCRLRLRQVRTVGKSADFFI